MQSPDLGFRWALIAGAEQHGGRTRLSYVSLLKQLLSLFTQSKDSLASRGMGVHGLTSYVDSIGGLWTRFRPTKTRVISMEVARYYHLRTRSQLNCQSGGQYEEFHNITAAFFHALKPSEVQVWVVLDGAFDASGRKFDTLTQRMRDGIADASRLANGPADCEHVLPLLARRTFVQTMEECGIKFVVCDW